MAFTKKHVHIMNAWARVTGEGCEDVWRKYGNFRDWCEPRWKEGATLVKIDEDLPWGPENAEWAGGNNPNAWTPSWSRQYHKTPAQTVNPCEKCRSADKCTKICPARAKWWDKKMEEVRRLVGA